MGWKDAVFVWALNWQTILGLLFSPELILSFWFLSWGFTYFEFWVEELRDLLSLKKQESLETTALAPDEVVSKFPCRAIPVKTTYHG